MQLLQYKMIVTVVTIAMSVLIVLFTVLIYYFIPKVTKDVPSGPSDGISDSESLITS